jgi:hypothetical protein
MNIVSLFLLLCAAFSQLASPPDQVGPASPPADPSPAAPFPAFDQPASSAEPIPVESPPNRVANPAGPRSVFQEITGPPASAQPELSPGRVESVPAPTASTPGPGRIQTEASARSLLGQALTAPAEAALRGTPLPLRAALERVQGNPQQLSVVTAYWRLAHAIATYHYALEETNFLMGLPLQPAARQQALLKAIQATARAAQAEAYLATLQAQHALAETAQLPGDALPVTVDSPFVGAYRTYFETLSARGAVPPRLERLDRTLPVLREVLDAHATAVRDTEAALAELDAAYQAGQANLGAVLEFYERLRQTRRQFLGAVRDYNESIALYALSVTGPGVLTPDRLVGMLVERPQTDHSVLASKRDSGIKRVSNDQPVGVPAPR